MHDARVREWFPGLFREDMDHLVFVDHRISHGTFTCVECHKKDGYTIYNVVSIWTSRKRKHMTFAVDGDGMVSAGIMWLQKGVELDRDVLWMLFDFKFKVYHMPLGKNEYKEYSQRCYTIKNIIT